MEVEYTLTVQDVEAFVRHHQTHGSRAKSQSRPVVSWVVWIVALLMAISWFTSNTIQRGIAALLLFLSGVGIGGATAIFLCVWMGKVAIRSAKRAFEDEHSRWMLSRRRVTIGPDGIALNSEYEHTLTYWPVIWRIQDTEDYAFFYTSCNTAHFVPRRAFRDQQHFEDFLALARRYQQGWEQPAPKPTGIVAGLPPESSAITRPDAS